MLKIDPSLCKKLIANHKRHFGDSVMPFRVTALMTEYVYRVRDDETDGFSDWLCLPGKRRVRCVGFKAQDGERVLIDNEGRRTVVDEDYRRAA